MQVRESKEAKLYTLEEAEKLVAQYREEHPGLDVGVGTILFSGDEDILMNGHYSGKAKASTIGAQEADEKSLKQTGLREVNNEEFFGQLAQFIAEHGDKLDALKRINRDFSGYRDDKGNEVKIRPELLPAVSDEEFSKSLYVVRAPYIDKKKTHLPSKGWVCPVFAMVKTNFFTNLNDEQRAAALKQMSDFGAIMSAAFKEAGDKKNFKLQKLVGQFSEARWFALASTNHLYTQIATAQAKVDYMNEMKSGISKDALKVMFIKKIVLTLSNGKKEKFFHANIEDITNSPEIKKAIESRKAELLGSDTFRKSMADSMDTLREEGVKAQAEVDEEARKEAEEKAKKEAAAKAEQERLATSASNLSSSASTFGGSQQQQATTQAPTQAPASMDLRP